MSSAIFGVPLNWLRDGVIRSCWNGVSIALTKLIGPKLAAWLCYWTIDWGPENKGPTFLCLFRESFIKDIEELRKRTELNLPVIMGGFTRLQMGWVPSKMQIQTFYQKYQGPGRESAMDKSRVFAKHLIELVNKRIKIDGVLSANFDYWQDSGFKEICRERGIPFLVLSREHPVIPKICDEVVSWYSKAVFAFEGTAIAVAGSSTKRVLKEIGHVCEDSRVTITGLPRYDAWIGTDCSQPPQKREFITLLTFTSGYYADETFKEVLTAFVESAKKHADKPVKFLVKTKDFGDTCYLKRMLPSGGGENLLWGHEFPLWDVLPKSRLAVNFNSLSLVEAAMARTPILLPAWGECQDRGSHVMYSIENKKVERVASFAYSTEEFKAAITNNINGQTKNYGAEQAEAFIGEFVHIPKNKTCSQEFLEFCKANLKPQCT